MFGGVGSAHGETASFIAADTFHEWNFRGRERSLAEACLESSRRVARYAKERRLKTCGATAAALLLDARGAALCNIGDSRICLLRDGAIRQLSAVDYYPPAAGRKPALLQYLGVPEQEMAILPHVASRPLSGGDLYLLCTGALADTLSEQAMLNCAENGSLEKIGGSLLSGALKYGRKGVAFFLVRILET